MLRRVCPVPKGECPSCNGAASILGLRPSLFGRYFQLSPRAPILQEHRQDLRVDLDCSAGAQGNESRPRVPLRSFAEQGKYLRADIGQQSGTDRDEPPESMARWLGQACPSENRPTQAGNARPPIEGGACEPVVAGQPPVFRCPPHSEQHPGQTALANCFYCPPPSSKLAAPPPRNYLANSRSSPDRPRR